MQKKAILVFVFLVAAANICFAENVITKEDKSYLVEVDKAWQVDGIPRIRVNALPVEKNSVIATVDLSHNEALIYEYESMQDDKIVVKWYLSSDTEGNKAPQYKEVPLKGVMPKYGEIIIKGVRVKLNLMANGNIEAEPLTNR